MSIATMQQVARGWIGTPRHDGQALKGHGCDCVGFLIGVAKEIGYLPADLAIPAYYQVARSDSLIKMLDQYLQRDNQGAIVAMAYNGIVTHVGILDGNELIHCHNRKGVISIPFTPYMQHKVKIRYSLKSLWRN